MELGTTKNLTKISYKTMNTKLEQKKKELKEIEKEIRNKQKQRKALDSYIRLYEWRKKKESEK